MSEQMWAKAYVFVDASTTDHLEMLNLIKKEGLTNVATTPIGKAEGWNRANALRDCREIDRADIVIVYVQDGDAPASALAVIAYACAKNIAIVLIAHSDNRILRDNNFVHHPLVTLMQVTDSEHALHEASRVLSYTRGQASGIEEVPAKRSRRAANK